MTRGCLSVLLVSVAVLFPAGPSSAANPGLCTSCHRADGRIAPDLAGRSATDLVAAIMTFRRGGRSHPNMESFSKSLSDDDIAALAAHFQALKPIGRAPTAVK